MNLDETTLLVLAGASLILLLVVVRWSSFDYRLKFLLAMLLTFEGISVALLASKVPWYVGTFLALVAGWQLLRLFRERPDAHLVGGMGTRFIKWLTNGGRLTRWFPLIGLVIAIGDVVANAWFFNGRLGSNDWVVLAAASSWIGYAYIPPIYFRERDFAFLFINLLVLVLVVPLVSYNLFIGSSGDGSMSLGELHSVEFFLAKPLENLLVLMGYEAFSTGDMLHYRLENGNLAIVSIAYGCSGLYSVVVFFAAFAAFVATEYNRFDSKAALLLLFGILTAYLANLFRMAIIVIVGHHRGIEAMDWTHANAGWLIFLFWVGIFWNLIFRFLAPPATEIRSEEMGLDDGRI
jgi:exosortase/archaeosortase family protein